jgi:hypothetical protein
LAGAQEETNGEKAGRAAVRPSRTANSLVERVSNELRQIQGRTRQERVQALENRKAELERLKGIAAESRALRRKLEALAEQISKLEKERDEKKAKLQKAEAERKKNEALARELVGRVKAYLDGVESRIAASIPWRKAARQTSLGEARKTTAGKSPSPSAALLAAARIQQEEEALGRLVESAKVNVKVGGEERQVFAFHLGLLGVVFANEDATVIGFAQAGETLEDGLKAASSSPEAAEGYLVAVDILRRRRTPAVVDLFLPTLKVTKEGE